MIECSKGAKNNNKINPIKAENIRAFLKAPKFLFVSLLKEGLDLKCFVVTSMSSLSAFHF